MQVNNIEEGKIAITQNTILSSHNNSELIATIEGNPLKDIKWDQFQHELEAYRQYTKTEKGAKSILEASIISTIGQKLTETFINNPEAPTTTITRDKESGEITNVQFRISGESNGHTYWDGIEPS